MSNELISSRNTMCVCLVVAIVALLIAMVVWICYYFIAKHYNKKYQSLLIKPEKHVYSENAEKVTIVGSIIKNVFLAISGVLFYIALFISITSSPYTYFSEVKDVEKDNIVVTGYFKTEYRGTDQVTIAIIVKNESEKTVEHVDVKETYSSKSATTDKLLPNQEEIISVTLYGSENYNFKIENIEYLK